MADTKTTSMFHGTLTPQDITKYTLFRGVTDYTNLIQFDLYETGYSYLICLEIPTFLERMRALNEDYNSLITNYRHVLEWEFRGAQGIEDITSDPSELTNGITGLNMITKVNEQGGSQFTMNYFERSGSILTKVNELFLRGIKDPKTQIKRYNGLLSQPLGEKTASKTEASQQSRQNSNDRDGSNHLANAIMERAGFQFEIFHFLLIVTDNTGLNVEKAYILACCQPTTANTSIYNVTRGEIGFQEIPITMNGIPIPGRLVTQRAQSFIKYINAHVCFDEMEYGYRVLDTSIYKTEEGSDEQQSQDTSFYDKIENANSGGTNITSSLAIDYAAQESYTNNVRPNVTTR